MDQIFAHHDDGLNCARGCMSAIVLFLAPVVVIAIAIIVLVIR